MLYGQECMTEVDLKQKNISKFIFVESSED